MEKIIQFGTSRFLQAHVDLFVSEAMKIDKSVGGIVVVKTTNSNERSNRLGALSAQGGFPVKIRGLQNGLEIDKTILVDSVKQTLTTENNWPQLLDIFVHNVEIVLSNTGDTGFEACPDDNLDFFTQSMSYPAKLNQLLKARFKTNGKSVQIMPMELVSNNGNVLKTRVLEIAGNNDPSYLRYLNDEVIWINSLVDRIVSEPINPVGAIAEPYALWAIEWKNGLKLPCKHDAIQVVDVLDRPETLKLFILNLGHTYLAHNWLKTGAIKNVSILDMLGDKESLQGLKELYASEILPAFASAGFEKLAQEYMDTTIERYCNPFLHHLLSDIAQNQRNKVNRRIVAFIEWAQNHGDFNPKPKLQMVIDANR